jgi:hypothetical protein
MSYETALRNLWNRIPEKIREEQEVIDDFIVLKKAITSISKCWWLDDERKAAISNTMKKSWSDRRKKLQLTWRSTGEELIVDSAADAARHVGKKAHTIEIYLSKGLGIAHFTHNDDVITIRSIPK